MPLSEHEQRILDEMERSLRGDQDVDMPSESAAPAAHSTGGARRYTIAIVGTLVGLVLVVLGAAQSNVIVGIVGFVAMLAAMIYGFGRPNNGSAAAGATSASGSKASSSASVKSSKSLNERMQDRWERRRRGEM